jgi:hypothetical protein
LSKLLGAESRIGGVRSTRAHPRSWRPPDHFRIDQSGGFKVAHRAKLNHGGRTDEAAASPQRGNSSRQRRNPSHSPDQPSRRYQVPQSRDGEMLHGCRQINGVRMHTLPLPMAEWAARRKHSRAAFQCASCPMAVTSLRSPDGLRSHLRKPLNCEETRSGHIESESAGSNVDDYRRTACRR